MKKSIINLVMAHGQNLVLTIIWAPFLILPCIGLYADEVNHSIWGVFFGSWIIQVFVTLFVHVIFFIPSYFWQQEENISLDESYQKAYPILLIPTAVYLLLCASSLYSLVGGENSIPIIITAMFCFISIYSLSLYTLLQKLLKQNDHEKINQ